MSDSKRFTSIDGLRGVAILMVLAVHYFVQQFQTEIKSVSPNLYAFLLKGSIGVDLFFVVSGFLIGAILMKHLPTWQTLKTFYLRRGFRILPLYWLALALAFLPNIGVDNGTVYVPFSWYLGFCQNLAECVGYLPMPTLAPTWSLAIEEHFYAFAPLMLLCFKRRGLIAFFTLAIIAAPCTRWIVAEGHFLNKREILYMFTLCRFDAIGMGLFAAWLSSKPGFTQWIRFRTLQFRITLCIMAAATIISCIPMSAAKNVWAATAQTIQAVFFAMLVIKCTHFQKSRTVIILNNSFLRFAGVRCYFLYVFHMAVLLLAKDMIDHQDKTFLHLSAILLALGMCFAYAQISWRYFEQPLIKHASRWKYQLQTLPEKETNITVATSGVQVQ